MKNNKIYRSLNFWIKFCTFVDEPQIALIFCNAYKEDHIFSDYVSGFSLWLPEMYWPLQRWLACQFRWIKQHLHIKKFYGTTEQDDIHSIFKVTKELSINSPESQYIEGYLFWDFIRTLVVTILWSSPLKWQKFE